MLGKRVLASRADALGCDVIAAPDHLGAPDPFVALTAAAGASARRCREDEPSRDLPLDRSGEGHVRSRERGPGCTPSRHLPNFRSRSFIPPSHPVMMHPLARGLVLGALLSLGASACGSDNPTEPDIGFPVAGTASRAVGLAASDTFTFTSSISTSMS